MAQHPVEIAVATRAYPGQSANGDACWVDWHGAVCRIAIIDGLGHGQPAAEAAAAACRVLAAHPELAPEPALRACHAALVSTRGAAMSVACIDVAALHLTYAAVGNTEAYLWRDGRQEHLMAYRGIVGAAFPRLRVFSFDLERQWLLLMCTDGIQSRAPLDARLRQPVPALQCAADGILEGFGRTTDDATVVLAGPAHA